ncbi:MAG: hypothetical protein IJX24_03545 [Oscillospiraceae bacterium]|nr:hypothetical protein [Oscillospiraceae bacterium]
MKKQEVCKATSVEECKHCPFDDCIRGIRRKLSGEDECIKIANLPVRGGIIPIAEDKKYARSERLV